MSGIDFLSNAFLKKDFQENYSKLQAQAKKNFEASLEANQVNNLGDVSCYSSDYEDEEIFTNRNTLKLWVNNEEIEVPADLVKVKDFKDILNKETFDTLFNPEEKEYLKSYLPTNEDQDKILDDLFSGKPFSHTSPLDTFFEKVKAGCYTKTFQKEQEIENRLAGIYSKNYYENITDFLSQRLEEHQLAQDKHQEVLSLIKRNATFDLESISADSEVSMESIGDLKAENSLDEISEGETVLEEVVNEAMKMPVADIEEELFQNRKFEAQRAATTFTASKKPEAESMMLTAGMPKSSSNKAPTKNVLTIKLSSKEWVDRYRAQETDRYNNPTKPWTFQIPEGGNAIVAPVVKKLSTAQNAKPREHFLLKPDRPAYITILCLVRDAAARLPNGEGTRADICELLKESQYINENTSEDKLSTVVSGALDRLHYEDDPCVKYDSDKKLWIYLHRDRTEEYGPWIDQSDSRSSKKKEYNQKYKVKKKLKTEESARSETDAGGNEPAPEK